MNVIQIYEMIRTMLDEHGSPRQDERSLYEAVNFAIEAIVNDRYDNLRIKKPYSFQAIQRVRDELFTLVNRTLNLTMSGDLLDYTVLNYPSNIRYLLDMSLKLSNGSEYFSTPIEYDTIGPTMRDPNKKPCIECTEARVYHNESSTGITFYWGDFYTAVTARFNYLKHPSVASHGNIRTTAYTWLINMSVIALDDTVYNGNTYYAGQAFTVIVATANQITSGRVVDGWTDTDLPQTLHHEIVARAAAFLAGSVENYQKFTFGKQEAEST